MSKVSLDVAQRLDITCRKGDTFNLVINVTNSSGVAENLTSYSFEMQLRETDVSTLPTIDCSRIHTAGRNAHAHRRFAWQREGGFVGLRRRTRGVFTSQMSAQNCDPSAGFAHIALLLWGLHTRGFKGRCLAK